MLRAHKPCSELAALKRDLETALRMRLQPLSAQIRALLEAEDDEKGLKQWLFEVMKGLWALVGVAAACENAPGGSACGGAVVDAMVQGFAAWTFPSE